MATVTGDSRNGMILVGGIAGSDGSISNCFNTGNLIGIMNVPNPLTAQMGGITGSPTEGFVYNVYNAGQIIKPVNSNLTQCALMPLGNHHFTPWAPIIYRKQAQCCL